MKHLLLFGAGKSATVLIEYLVKTVQKEGWQLTVVDANLELVQQKLKGAPQTTAASFDISDGKERRNYITQADIVISLLPPALHSLVARDCIACKKNLLTASYVDGEMKKLATEIKNNNLLFLCEMGLDPGIDHMSAKAILDAIAEQGGTITSFFSHCGGLVAPESDDNPWHYKISWNPRNVVLAGKAGAVYKQHGFLKKLDYAELFSEKRYTAINGLAPLCWYPNRDSLSYLELYDLHDCQTFVRTTLRHPDFMDGWKNIIDLQLTDETVQYKAEEKSLKEIFNEHLEKHHLTDWWKQRLQHPNRAVQQLLFLGFDDAETKLHVGACSAADFLQYALEKNLGLKALDKDMVVMKHEIEYLKNEQPFKHTSTLIVKGENNQHTAMAKTVGLPLGIAAKLILQGRISSTGLQIPVSKKIYGPVLAELAQHGIQFTDKTEPIV